VLPNLEVNKQGRRVSVAVVFLPSLHCLHLPTTKFDYGAGTRNKEERKPERKPGPKPEPKPEQPPCPAWINNNNDCCGWPSSTRPNAPFFNPSFHRLTTHCFHHLQLHNFCPNFHLQFQTCKTLYTTGLLRSVSSIFKTGAIFYSPVFHLNLLGFPSQEPESSFLYPS